MVMVMVKVMVVLPMVMLCVWLQIHIGSLNHATRQLISLEIHPIYTA